MARRGKDKGRRVINTKPETTTPWFNNSDLFNPKSARDRRAESAFFSEFSTESLFATGPGANGPRDPYEVLGLFPGASLDQVKKAHRNLAKRYHPDRHTQVSEMEARQAEQKMVLVNAAYAELLSRVVEQDDRRSAP
jgi:DnaJ-domain-containing protein 1